LQTQDFRRQYAHQIIDIKNFTKAKVRSRTGLVLLCRQLRGRSATLALTIGNMPVGDFLYKSWQSGKVEVWNYLDARHFLQTIMLKAGHFQPSN